MTLNSRRERYPYSRNRALLSAIIAILATIFALIALSGDKLLVLYYFFATFIVAAVTFFMKKRLYPLLITGDRQIENESEMKGTSWKTLLAVFFMLVGFIAIPLLSARFLSASLWFIMITSFMSGVSISEIVLYTQASYSR